ncbi:serine protease, partial [Clostridium perfringens]|nr:serine protease [Clostridium perfringens]
RVVTCRTTMASYATFTLLVLAGFLASAYSSSSPARIEDYPSTVQLETGIGRVWLQTCVGSVLTSRHVLTAAHCLIGTALIPRISRVRAGTSERGRGGDVWEVNSVIRHPDYSLKAFEGNVGIVRLQTALWFGAAIQQARITASGVTFPANVPVTLAGWGRTSQEDLWADRDLHSTQLYTVDHSLCVEKYGDLKVPIAVTENMICAATLGTTGANFGVRDGGSPVFYDGILVGFVSFGSPLSATEYPLVATAASPYSDWIVENAV